MKRTLSQLIAVALISILSPLTASSQNTLVSNQNHSTSSYVNSDGRIQDKNYRTVGYVKSDGRILDASYRTVGYVKNGKV